MSLPRTTKISVPGDSLSSSRNQPSVLVEGRGLHSGRLCRVRVSPGAVKDQGIMFRHVRDGIEYSSHAYWLRVSGTSRATALILRGESRRRFELFTVEHFLAAALLSGYADLDVELELPEGPADALELPALDGSAADWANALRGLPTPAPVERVCWKVIRSIEIQDGPKRVVFSPLTDARDESLTRYHYSVDFGGSLQQSAFFEIDWRSLGTAQARFLSEIAPARTFGFKAELEQLEKRGLARGASMANAILLDGDRVVNPEGLRFENELAAHKLMDCVGDFALLGAPFLGRVDLTAAGHSMHLRALEEAYRTGALVRGRLPANGPFIRD